MALYTLEYPEVRWWVSDTEYIKVSDMTTQHIYNCINLIKRTQAAGKEWRVGAIPYFYQELYKRGLHHEDPVGKVKVYNPSVICLDHIDLERSINDDYDYRDC